MKRIIQLNSDDIRDLISEKYEIPKTKIKIEAWGSSQDGIYYQPCGCIFSFDEDYIGSFPNLEVNE